MMLEVVSGLSVDHHQRKILLVGTRPSPLAQVQANAVAEALYKTWKDQVETRLVNIKSTGDVRQTGGTTKTTIQEVPLAVKAVDFTGALDDALLSTDENVKIDVAVHSLKDIPPTARWLPGLQIAAHLPREKSSDVLVGPYPSFESLPQHAKVGTSSARRQAQLWAARPDLELVNLRGNVEARLQALADGSVDSLILALAGLHRLGFDSGDNVLPEIRTHAKIHPIPSEDLLPGACQGIVAVVCKATDTAVLNLVRPIDHLETSIAAATERSFLDRLDSFRPCKYQGTTLWEGRPPLAALMEKKSEDSATWLFRGLLSRPDGSKVLRIQRIITRDLTITEASDLGRSCAQQLIDEAGAEFFRDA